MRDREMVESTIIAVMYLVGVVVWLGATVYMMFHDMPWLALSSGAGFFLTNGAAGKLRLDK